jgi:hypothetical protein
MNRASSARAAIALTALTLLFALRVSGQALVAFLDVGWLPPMAAWYSGLVPYPILLAVQIVILAVQVRLDWHVWRRGWAPPPRGSTALRWVSYAYALAMLVRLVLRPAHAIPVFFHWVLAAYVYTLGAISGGRTPRAAGR